MKVFILNPAVFMGKSSNLDRARQPLSLAYIASLLRNKHDIKLLDANVLDLSLKQTISEIKKFSPDVFLLTSSPIDRWEYPSLSDIKVLIKNIIEIGNQVKIRHTILIGAHGSVMPEWMLEKSKVSFVVRGEPELTVVKLINALSKREDFSNLKGVSYVKEDKFINNPDADRNKELDALPFPAYDLLPMEKYSYTFPDIPKPFSIMLASRGCPFNCIYCLKVMMHKGYFMRSPENVVKEIKYLVDKFKVRGIYFQDWEFSVNNEWVNKICDLILKNGIEIKWGCNARASDVHDKIIKKMKQAGCVRVNIGFESGSQKVLDLANKKIKLSEIIKAANICRDNDIKFGIYSILNLPGETRETIKETEKFLVDNNLKTMCVPNLPIPYIGTQLYQMLKEQEGRDFSWDDLEYYSGKVGVSQPPWLARIYRWHYKYKYSMGSLYYLKFKFYRQFFKLIKSKI